MQEVSKNVLHEHDALSRYQQKHGDCQVPDSTGDPIKKRLEDIGLEVSRLAHVAHENWEAMLEALKAYKNKHGDCRVPYNFFGDSSLPRPLGGWVTDQRTRLPAKVKSGHQVSIDRHKKLDDIGFDWDANCFQDRWMAMYNQLVKYHSEHGNCRVSDTYDARLCKWVRMQKARVLSKANNGHPVYLERKQRLDALDFEYDNVHEAKWEEMFGKLKQYYLEHGNCRVPKDFDDGNCRGISLFKWIRDQRRILEYVEKGVEKYVERKKLLDSINFSWEYVDEGKWMAMFDALKAYKNKHGHCDVEYGYCEVNIENNTKRALGAWCHEQRQKIPSKLACRRTLYDYAERKRLLDSIGFEWKVLSDKEKIWNVYLERLQAFKAKNGHFQVPPDKGGDRFSLYHWVKKQQKMIPPNAEKGDPLYVERKKRLDAIGFVWHGIMDNLWEKMFLALAEYKKKHGHTRVPNRSKGSEAGAIGKLGIWVYSQRVKLPPKVAAGDQVAIAKKQKLDELGFQWADVKADVNAEKWEIMFTGLVRFYDKHGHCKVSRQYKDESNPLPANLGTWMSVQRQVLLRKVEAGDEIAIERKERLDALGFVWQTRASPKTKGKQTPNEQEQSPNGNRGQKRKLTDCPSSNKQEQKDKEKVSMAMNLLLLSRI